MSSRVSLSPSKIPYGGFSPVRLQTRRQVRPSSNGTYTHPQPAPRVSVAASGKQGEPVRAGILVQRPLARHRVVLSRRVIAYYGLIRASRGLPATYEFVTGSLLPPVARGSPIYSACLSRRAISVPRRTGTAACGCHFTAHSGLHRFRIGSASAVPRVPVRARRVTRLIEFAFATARRVASPAPARTFTLELSPPGSPQIDVEYDYTGRQPAPAAGLPPARHAAVWAANGKTRINRSGGGPRGVRTPCPTDSTSPSVVRWLIRVLPCSSVFLSSDPSLSVFFRGLFQQPVSFRLSG